MNKLTVSILDYQTEDVEVYKAVELKVDGVSLIEIFKQAERPMAEAEGHPKLAGAYSWLFASTSTRQELSSATGENEKATLLECKCGEPGCWPLLVQIEFNELAVTWRNFEQRHRGEEAVAGHWSYSHLGSFTFRREEYEHEIAKI